MRLLIVSNRLPVTATKQDNNIVFKRSVGGVATGLSSYLNALPQGENSLSEYLWIGWPGMTVEESQKPLLVQEASRFQSYPVFLTHEQMENFYHGFCNKTIWALFHYFPSLALYKKEYWEHYVHVNKVFCRAVLKVAAPGDVVWIHDYHLMLLPSMLRAALPDLPIGFFLHIPFPSFEVFRLLPSKWRNEILEGILGADLIGFHTQDYVQYFLRCVSRLLGYDHGLGEISLSRGVAKVDTFPMGIDFEKFFSTAGTAEVQKEKMALRKRFPDSRFILSIDRLDYSKGILNRLQGYEEFLAKHLELHGRVVLLLVVVPSRIGVEHYQRMKTTIEEFVGRLNGRFGTIHWTPILYQYRSLPFTQLVALYSASDIMLVTPLRDGMNLIAKEYIASRRDRSGVLILSEMAGAAKELGEAIIINPNNVEEIAGALVEALAMPAEEQILRNEVMQTRLKRYNVVRWADEFIQSLLSFMEHRKNLEAKLLGAHSKEQMFKEFKNANSRLLLLDYDGTLVGFTGNPQSAKPDARLLAMLDQLGKSPTTDIVIVSGRDKGTLQRWFNGLDVSLVAEHGMWIKEHQGDWRLMKHLNNDWKNHLLSVLSRYMDRLPRSLLEEKDYSISFHYREADPDQASVRIKELVDNLVHFTKNADLHVLQGNKVVEIRNATLNKGTAAQYFLSRKQYDFILCVGDDWTDEDMFTVLPERAYSLKVGVGRSNAKSYLRTPAEVIALIQEFASIASRMILLVAGFCLG